MLTDSELIELELQARIEGEVRCDALTRALYATDASVYQIHPVAVVIPRSEADVVETVEFCREHELPLTARGGGTSQAGQAIGAGVQLDFSKYLNQVLEVNPEEEWVRVQPGIVLDDLNAHLRPYGLQFPVDISTSDRATLGGMIANNSAGTRSVVYGKTLDYVQSLKVLLADGTITHFTPAADEAELALRKTLPGLEGECYRTVARLAQEHRGEIERRFPRILRRVGGYNLDEFLPGRGPFHLGRLVVGSEGTLALVLEATLRVVPLPQARILALVHFDSLLEALEATPLLLQQGPSAVELVDRFILDTTRNSPRFQALRQEFIQGDPAALLMVEWSGGSAAALADCTEAAEEALRRAGLGWFFLRVSEPAAQSRAWSLRRGALGLSMSERGDAKAISFVEDTAVDPARLRDYIERFLALLEEQSTTAGFYAHASVGLLHVRPVVNLKTEAGVTQFQRIAAAVADLVLEFGGALSGEHGDGLVRSPFQERMFGPVLYQAFREIKRTFDPYGLFNPGKIVDAPPLTENLRFGPNTITRDPLTVLDFEEFGGIARAAEQCAGIGECRKRRSGTMCPSFMATRDERDSTRGRANALRQALAGELGGEGLASRELQQALELCLECKACKIECPTGVDMARLKAEVLHHQRRAHGLTLRDFLLSRPHVLAAFGSANPRLANQLLASRLGRFAARRLGLAADRRFPQLAETPFTAPHSSDPGRARETGRWGVLFVDTFTHYFEPEVAQAAWELMQAEGTEVVVLQGPCCGRPLLSRGFLEEARRQAERLLIPLVRASASGTPIVFLEPSCQSMVRDDYLTLLPREHREAVADVARACVSLEEWAAGSPVLFPPPALEPSRFTPAAQPVLVHPHCHQPCMGNQEATLRALRGLPGTPITPLETGCCGMAGAFGYEHAPVSRQIAAHRLLPALAKADPEAVVAAPGFSCRSQIRELSGRAARHPAQILRDNLILSPAEYRRLRMEDDSAAG